MCEDILKRELKGPSKQVGRFRNTRTELKKNEDL